MFIKNASVQGTLQDIEIDGGRIKAISPSGRRKTTADSDVDANGNMVIVGFADSHMHLDKSMLALRAEYEDVVASEKGRLTREQKAKLTEEDIYQNARMVIQRAIANGTIAIRTNVDVDPLVELRGVRALLRLREEFKEILNLQVIPIAQEGVYNYPKTPALLRQALDLGSDGVGGHTIIDNDGQGHIDTILEIAKEYDVTCDLHVDESGKREHFLLPYLAQKTIEFGLQGRVNGVHACTLAALDEKTVKETLAISKEAGLRFMVAPTAISTRNLTITKELVAAGFPVTLGSDNVGDFFNPLGGAHALHVAVLLAYVHRYFTKSERRTVLEMVSSGANGLFHRELGDEGITVGAPADITIIDGANPREVLSRVGAPWLVVRNGRIISRREEHLAFGLFDG